MAYKPKVLNPLDGGTGVSNASSSTVTLGGSLATSGAHSTTFTITGDTNVTFPTSGTLATTSQIPSITATQYDVLVGGATNSVVSVGPGSAGQVFQSAGNGSNPGYSTATYPSTATSTGTIMRADGTNWVASTSTYPNTNAVSTLLYASSANVMSALATANNSALVTNASGIPSLGTSLTNDFTYTSSTAGATRSLTVSNTDNSNTASTALSQITTGGASSGDPFQTFTVSGATSWSHGIDNSVSDNYVLAASTALGTTNVMSATTSGAVSYGLGNVDVTKSASGVDVSITASNTSNSASSTATHYATVAGTSAGDAQTQYAVAGTTTWTEGIDNSVTGDPYVLSASNALGTTNVISATTSGQINYPLQPCFSARLATTVATVTGDGTLYTIIFDSEDLDVGANFNLGTSVFTAPVTGKYLFNVICTVSISTSTATSEILSLVTTGHTYRIWGSSSTTTDLPTGINGSRSGSILTQMTAGDTAKVTLIVSGANKTCSVAGESSSLGTYFSGMLVA